MAMRLGELLVSRGVLTPMQVERIVAVQEATARPFGEIAEALYDVAPQDVEQAWAAQIAAITERFDAEHDGPAAPDIHRLVGRRQAWQFAVLPLRREDGVLLVATTETLLPRAARFLAWHLAEPVMFVLATDDELDQALQQHYALPGAKLNDIDLRRSLRPKPPSNQPSGRTRHGKPDDDGHEQDHKHEHDCRHHRRHRQQHTTFSASSTSFASPTDPLEPIIRRPRETET